ncbi:hypothetical protein C1646_774708 [Rhizophagus diaphanus]|nr:hypothetical protein C1646_774708 [Rhizophagus diaphanus] [Rhizophagus sp. MUCL 43196]
MDFESAPFRTHENMQQVIRNEQKKDHLVHSTCNAFWKFLNLNIYEACVPDRIHHIDLGLFKYQLDFTQQILKEVREVDLQREFDNHLHQIPRFPILKLIGNLGHLNVITAADYRNIMKIVLFALDDIFDGLWNEVTCDELKVACQN